MTWRASVLRELHMFQLGLFVRCQTNVVGGWHELGQTPMHRADVHLRPKETGICHKDTPTTQRILNMSRCDL